MQTGALGNPASQQLNQAVTDDFSRGIATLEGHCHLEANTWRQDQATVWSSLPIVHLQTLKEVPGAPISHKFNWGFHIRKKEEEPMISPISILSSRDSPCNVDVIEALV